MGWYSTGPRLREADVDINQLMANYCDSPVLVICEVEVRPPPCRLRPWMLLAAAAEVAVLVVASRAAAFHSAYDVCKVAGVQGRCWHAYGQMRALNLQ